jgi:hypothetical protein
MKRVKLIIKNDRVTRVMDGLLVDKNHIVTCEDGEIILSPVKADESLEGHYVQTATSKVQIELNLNKQYTKVEMEKILHSLNQMSLREFFSFLGKEIEARGL